MSNRHSNKAFPETSRMTNVVDYLDSHAQQFPDQIAIYEPYKSWFENDLKYHSLTYKQLQQRTYESAFALEAAGIESAMFTVVMIPPSINFFTITFALFRIGAIPIFIDPGIGLRRMRAVLQPVQPAALIGVAKATLAQKLFKWASNSVRITIRSAGKSSKSMGGIERSYAKYSQRGPYLNYSSSTDHHPFQLSNESVTALLFTSGSTGPCKGVEYSQKHFLRQIQLLKELYQIEPGEPDLCTFPLFALFAPALGMTTIIPKMDFTRPGFVDPVQIITPIQKFAVTNLFGSPALLDRIGKYTQRKHLQLSSLKRVISAGAPAENRILSQLQPSLPEHTQIYTPYGATEALPIASIGSKVILHETLQWTDVGAGVCVGKPAPVTDVKIIKITDQGIDFWNDQLLAEDREIGEITVCGDQVTSSYFKLLHENEKSKILMPNGQTIRHRMGDLGYFDELGRIWFCGRKSERVITASGTLFTTPCEGVFNAYPGVLQSALIGIPLENGTIPVICIRANSEFENSRARAVLIEELKLHGNKFPHTKEIVHFVLFEKFPTDKRHNSKIDRKLLSRWALPKIRSALEQSMRQLNSISYPPVFSTKISITQSIAPLSRTNLPNE